MEPNELVAEVYRRMSARRLPRRESGSGAEILSRPKIIEAAHQYAQILPSRKDATIIDIGFGGGWFMAVCASLDFDGTEND